MGSPVRGSWGRVRKVSGPSPDRPPQLRGRARESQMLWALDFFDLRSANDVFVSTPDGLDPLFEPPSGRRPGRRAAVRTTPFRPVACRPYQRDTTVLPARTPTLTASTATGLGPDGKAGDPLARLTHRRLLELSALSGDTALLRGPTTASTRTTGPTLPGDRWCSEPDGPWYTSPHHPWAQRPLHRLPGCRAPGRLRGAGGPRGRGGGHVHGRVAVRSGRHCFDNFLDDPAVQVLIDV